MVSRHCGIPIVVGVHVQVRLTLDRGLSQKVDGVMVLTFFQLMRSEMATVPFQDVFRRHWCTVTAPPTPVNVS